MLYLSKCNVSENFEINMNIMYRIAKDIAIEEKIEIINFKNSINENILKLFDSEIIIILIIKCENNNK